MWTEGVAHAGRYSNWLDELESSLAHPKRSFTTILKAAERADCCGCWAEY
jgi:hypothetical protein